MVQYETILGHGVLKSYGIVVKQFFFCIECKVWLGLLFQYGVVTIKTKGTDMADMWKGGG